MPLYDDLEVRPRYGSALPSYAPDGVRLEAPPVDMNQIIGESALQGILDSIPLAPTYAGLRSGVARSRPDPWATDRAAFRNKNPFVGSYPDTIFAADNPMIAGSYLGDLEGQEGQFTARAMSREHAEGLRAGGGRIHAGRLPPGVEFVDIPTEPILGGYAQVERNAMAYGKPSRISAELLAEEAAEMEALGKRKWPSGFSKKAVEYLPAGMVQRVENIVDPGDFQLLKHDPHQLYNFPSNQYAWGRGVDVTSVGKPMKYSDLQTLVDDAAGRLGIDIGKYDPVRERFEGQEGSRLYGKWGTSTQSPGAPRLPEKTRRVLAEIENDPRFAGGEGKLVFRGLKPLNEPPLTRAANILKAGGKGLLKGLTPAALLEGALLAGPVSGLSGGAGYASAAPQSSGLFTPPGPGYEGLVTAEDIIAAAEAKEALKEQERQRLLEQYRATGYDLDPNTRLSDLR